MLQFKVIWFVEGFTLENEMLVYAKYADQAVRTATVLFNRQFPNLAIVKGSMKAMEVKHGR